MIAGTTLQSFAIRVTFVWWLQSKGRDMLTYMTRAQPTALH